MACIDGSVESASYSSMRRILRVHAQLHPSLNPDHGILELSTSEECTLPRLSLQTLWQHCGLPALYSGVRNTSNMAAGNSQGRVLHAPTVNVLAPPALPLCPQRHPPCKPP